MSDGKVITAYILAVIFWAIIPWSIGEHYPWQLIPGAAIMIIWWIIASLSGDKILLWSMKAEKLNVAKYKEIVDVVNSQKFGPKVATPSLWMIGDLAPMVLSVGLSPKQSHLIFSRGFLERMDDKVQMALVVRELQSIMKGATAANTGGATLLWFTLLPGKLVSLLTGLAPGESNILTTIVNIFPALFAGIYARILTDKKAVYELDRQASRLMENPGYMPYALKELQEKLQGTATSTELSASGCCVVNPNNNDPFIAMFKLKPPTPKRIEKLLPKRNGK